jgi:hypothetical protein
VFFPIGDLKVKRTIEHLICLAILCVASTCIGQITYTATALRSAYDYTAAVAVNDQGRVVGIGGTGSYYTALLWMQPGTSPQEIVPANLKWIYSGVIAITNRGQVLGYGYEADWTARAYLYDSNTGVFRILDIPDLPVGINERGTVFGISGGHNGYDPTVLFTYDDGTVALHPTPPGSTFCCASAINNSGDIAGVFMGLPAIYDAKESRWISISVPGAIAGGLKSINDKGRAVGYWIDASHTYHPLITQKNEVLNSSPTIAGYLEFINNRGWATGIWADASARIQPLVARKDGSIEKLISPVSSPLAFAGVSNDGIAVSLGAWAGYPTDPYAYDIPTGKWTDLGPYLVNIAPAPGFVYFVNSVTSDGRIVGVASEIGKPTVADGFLLTPVAHEKKEAADSTLR